MKTNLITALLPCCLLLCFGICFGQSPADSLQSRAATATIENFNTAIGKQSWLYNGPGYDLGRRITKGNANFLDTTIMDTKGSIVYNGFAYKNVPLLYNINKDLLISEWSDGFSSYSFINEKLSEFNLFNHHFIRVSPDTIAKRVVKPGFYEELYAGKLQVLEKHVKLIHIVHDLLSPDDYYDTKVYYYLKKNGLYHAIGSEGDILDILQDQKQALKKYIKDSDVKFRRDPEQALVMLATYYDHLTN